MQMQNILNILYDTMPKLRTDFSDQLDVTSIVSDATGLITVTCGTEHGLVDTNYVVTTGYQDLNEVTAVNGQDVTLTYKANILNDGETSTVDFQTAGTLNFVSITDDRLTITVEGTPPLVGDNLLDYQPNDWVNGTYTITVLDDFTFTYQTSFTQASTFLNGFVHTRLRIYGSINPELGAADNQNSSLNFSEPKILIVPLDITTSKSRYNLNDATNFDTPATSNKQTVIRDFAVVLLYPIADQLNSIEIYDMIDGEVQKDVLTCLYGQEVDAQAVSTMNYLGAAVIQPDLSQIQYIMNFEYQTSLTYDDIRESQGRIITKVGLTLNIDQETVEKEFGE